MSQISMAFYANALLIAIFLGDALLVMWATEYLERRFNADPFKAVIGVMGIVICSELIVAGWLLS
jgi:xanthosine utilization system XapX-like protein